MISLSNGGSNTFQSSERSDLLLVGTVDGVFQLRRSGETWTVAHRGLRGCNFSAVTETPNGSVFAASHGIGVARSRDQGTTWTWCNKGLDHLDLWAARGGRLQGRDVACVGTLPAHLYLTEDDGETWRRLPGFDRLSSRPSWYFPPVPHFAHVKDIVIDGDRLMVGVEIGTLAVSTDFGESFSELPVDPDPTDCDIHRIIVHPARPERIVVANGIVGVMTSQDGGMTWSKNPMPQNAHYPDPIVANPHDSDELFLGAGDGWPGHWYQRGRACGRIVRSRDGGQTWERLLGGLPDGQRAAFSALSVEAYGNGISLYAADTDGQVFESLDRGDHWTIIAEVAPVSKGEFYRAMVRERPRMPTIDDTILSESARIRLDRVRVLETAPGHSV